MVAEEKLSDVGCSETSFLASSIGGEWKRVVTRIGPIEEGVREVSIRTRET